MSSIVTRGAPDTHEAMCAVSVVRERGRVVRVFAFFRGSTTDSWRYNGTAAGK